MKPKFSRKGSLVERYWQRVNKDGPVVREELGPCWDWTAGRHDFGYGTIAGNGRRHYAHRLGWEFANGPIPDGMCVCHKCDRPQCCNPGHFFLGTPQDNTADAVSKKRWPRGADHWMVKNADLPRRGSESHFAKLNEDDVRKILALDAEGLSMPAIAARFNCKSQNVWCILRGKSWRHITGRAA